MRYWQVAALWCCFMVSMSCGSFFSTCHDCSPPPPADNSGSWTGSIEVPSIGGGGNIDMAMVQMGESIQSTRMQISSAVGPPDCGITRNMTGEIDGANVVMTITENIGDELHRNDRHRHDERDLFVDLYLHKRHQRDIQLHVDAFDYEYAVEGTITSSTTTSFTATLNEDTDANLTGAVQFAGTACTNAVSVTGSVTGIQVYFQDTQGGALVNAGGTISGSDAKSIGGSAGGSCDGGIGSLTMSR